MSKCDKREFGIAFSLVSLTKFNLAREQRIVHNGHEAALIGFIRPDVGGGKTLKKESEAVGRGVECAKLVEEKDDIPVARVAKDVPIYLGSKSL